MFRTRSQKKKAPARIPRSPFLPAVLLAALLGLVASGCGRNEKANAQTAEGSPVTVREVNGESTIEMEHPERFPLTQVEGRPVVEELRATCVVAPDVSRTVPVLSLAGGRAGDLRARLGDDVRRGQVLLVISSPDVAQAFSDYQKAQADEVLAQKELTRSQELYAKGAIAQKDLETAQDAEQKARVDTATATARIRILGADLDRPSPLVEVRAPISGTIVEQNVAGGAGVRSMDNSPNLFTIADLSRVWVLCDVYENDLARVHPGDWAEVRLNAYPDRALKGRVGNISRVLDSATRTAKVRLELENPGHLMRVGMFGTAIFRSRSSQVRPVVPTTAILRLHDKDWVFCPEGGNRYRRREVEAGPVLEGGLQTVLSGLSPGDKVVGNALQFASAAALE